MLFNSLEFAVFLPLVFALYWLLQSYGTRAQNLLLLVASYVFYGWWDWRFLALIALSSLVDFGVGLFLTRPLGEWPRRVALLFSVVANLGLLGAFKYYNFFIDNLSGAFQFFGHPVTLNHARLILPVGISFYTFQTMSYTIDVYRGKIASSTHPIDFFAYVSFFPQLVAGPIERASNLLPQFATPRCFDAVKAADGMKQILWGLFKKVAIADTCALFVNEIFARPTDYSGLTLLLGAMLFAIQIYGDFSGYSDIAIGVSRLFGFSLMQNFAFPYFSRDIAEFWRRWHISLSTWFRDYLYIPLGGSRGKALQRIRNVFVIFLVSGFWHGANWTFVTWGALNALYFLPLLLLNRNRKNTDTVAENRVFPSLGELSRMTGTFLLVCMAWIFFRAENLSQAGQYLHQMVSHFVPDSLMEIKGVIGYKILALMVLIGLMVRMEWINRFGLHGLARRSERAWYRYSVYLLVATVVLYTGNYHNPSEFIYFQF